MAGDRLKLWGERQRGPGEGAMGVGREAASHALMLGLHKRCLPPFSWVTALI